MESIEPIFKKEVYVKKIQKKLPELFQIAEIESQRGGKIGMEVGTIRERILVALLLYVFGEENVETDIPTTESEIDVKLYKRPISIKTFTGNKWNSVKLIWTVDWKMVEDFQRNYSPKYGILLTHINWGGLGGLYYFSQSSQKHVLNKIGKGRYIKLPKQGTNPRGVEISTDALKELYLQEDTLEIPITWEKQEIKYNMFNRWIELWETD
ncbi:MAG: ThaI family type II restriction endonuclease [Bacteroidales bacterium]